MTPREIDEQVAIALGWTQEGPGRWWKPPGSGCAVFVHPSQSESGRWSTDLSLAMGLLLNHQENFRIDIRRQPDGDRVGIEWLNDAVKWEELASGPKDQAPRVMCEAFLKLKGPRND